MTELKTETEFRSVVNEQPGALVCFHSTRSAYSRRTIQVLSELAAEFPAVKFCAFDADPEPAQPLLAEQHVVALPTVIYFRHGQPSVCFVGERTNSSWQKILTSVFTAQSPGGAK